MEGQPCVALLGLDGFVVTAAEEVDGEMHVWAETDRTRPPGCPECGVIPQPAALKERCSVRVRDLPVAGRPAVLVWSKRRWRCLEPLCPRGSSTETHPAMLPRQVLTERARERICQEVSAEADSVAGQARQFEVGWHTAWKAVVDQGKPKVDDPARLAGVSALGVDETAWLAATRTHHTPYVSGLVDLATGRLLDVVEDRTATAVGEWLAGRDPEWLAGISTVALDPHCGYANAMTSHVGHARMVVDHFHVARLGNAAVDDARRRVLASHRRGFERPMRGHQPGRHGHQARRPGIPQRTPSTASACCCTPG